MNLSLSLAVRTYLLRKNLASLPFELVGVAAALLLTSQNVMAVVYLILANLLGHEVGRRIAHATPALDRFSVKEIKDFQDPSPLLVSVSLFMAPLIVALALWQAGLSGNQVIAWSGLGMSLLILAYRYLAYLKERSRVQNA